MHVRDGQGEQQREGGSECWMFRVKERVGGSSEGRQQGYTVKRREGRKRKNEFMVECDSVQCMGDGTEWLHRTRCWRGVRGRPKEISNKRRHLLLSKPAVSAGIRLEVVCPQWSTQLWGIEKHRQWLWLWGHADYNGGKSPPARLEGGFMAVWVDVTVDKWWCRLSQGSQTCNFKQDWAWLALEDLTDSSVWDLLSEVFYLCLQGLKC